MVLSCGSDPISGDRLSAVQSDTLIPLNIGNRWSYKLEMFDTLTSAVMDTRFTFEQVFSDSVIGGKKWYSFGSPSIFYRTDSLGHRMIYADLDTSYLIYKYPTRVGEKFVGFAEEGSEVISLSKPITVTAGHFDCVEYRSNAFSDFDPLTRSLARSYVAPGVGLVLVETYNADGTRLRSRSTLQSYTLIKP
jgi:hypothetical protein